MNQLLSADMHFVSVIPSAVIVLPSQYCKTSDR